MPKIQITSPFQDKRQIRVAYTNQTKRLLIAYVVLILCLWGITTSSFPASLTVQINPMLNSPDGGYIKIRSHAHAVTDWIYCPEPPGSPRPQATGCPGVLGIPTSNFYYIHSFTVQTSFSFHLLLYPQLYCTNRFWLLCFGQGSNEINIHSAG